MKRNVRVLNVAACTDKKSITVAGKIVKIFFIRAILKPIFLSIAVLAICSFLLQSENMLPLNLSSSESNGPAIFWKMESQSFSSYYNSNLHKYYSTFWAPDGWVVLLTIDPPEGMEGQQNKQYLTAGTTYTWKIKSLTKPYTYTIKTKKHTLFAGGPVKLPRKISQPSTKPDSRFDNNRPHLSSNPQEVDNSKPKKKTDEDFEMIPKFPWLGTYEITLELTDSWGMTTKVSKKITLRHFLIVSIGDSYASGEGNPDIPGKPDEFEPEGHGFMDYLTSAGFVVFEDLWEVGSEAFEWSENKLKKKFTTISADQDATIDMNPKPIWLEKEAHRSLKAGPALAALKIDNRFNKLSTTRTKTRITYLSFARSGATINNGLLGPRMSNGKSKDNWINDIGELEEVKRTLGNTRIDALIISIGGNDVGFSKSLSDLVGGDDWKWGVPKYGGDAETRNKIKAESYRKIAELFSPKGDYHKMCNYVYEELNVDQVYATGYPVSLFEKMDSHGKPYDAAGCGIFQAYLAELDISPADARVIREIGMELNDHYKDLERIYPNWHYLSVEQGFRGHGYCAEEKDGEIQRYFITAEGSFFLQGDTKGTMHPNAFGHKVYRDEIYKAVEKQMKATKH